MSKPHDDLLEVTMAYGDRWFDDRVGLLWNPPGSFAPLVPDLSVHLLPQSAWYALGLVLRRGDGDLARAAQVLDALLDHQYDRPGTVWHGTFSRVAEAAEPTDGAVEWIDYDPNWRQFIGTTLLLVLRTAQDDLDVVQVSRIDRALRLAVDGEPLDRVDPSYSNIALMKAVLEVEVGARLDDEALVERGEALAAAVVARFDRFGAFDEYNSPTYYGVDLLGLGLWRTCAVSASLRERGERIESVLWDDLALFFHPGLANLVGPYSRTYGMDMGRYTAALSLWLWGRLGRPHAPMPDPLEPEIDHGHDLLLGPVVIALAGAVPTTARSLLSEPFFGVRQVERVIGEDPPRLATAWLEEQMAFGAEEQHEGWHAGGQYAPATLHWRLPSGGVGTVRAFCDAPTSARAVDASLTISCAPPTGDEPGAVPLVFLVEGVEPTPGAFEVGRWRLPGLELRVQSTSTLASVEPFGSHLLVTYTAGEGSGHRVVLRRLHADDET